MGYVKVVRSEKILEKIISDYVEDGVLPTSEELQEEFDIASSEHGRLETAALQHSTNVTRWTNSSASQINSFLDYYIQDMDTFLEAMTRLGELNIRTVVEWAARSKSLESRLIALQSRMDSLLLNKSDTAGYLAFVEDGFRTLENISSDTTTSIDVETGEVTLKVSTAIEGADDVGQMVDTSGANVDWRFIEGNNVKVSTQPSGSALKNVLLKGHNIFQSVVTTKLPQDIRSKARSNKPIVGELKVSLPEKKEISRILYLQSDPAAGNSTTVSAQYTTDGYTWQPVPGESATQTSVGDLSFRFPGIEVSGLKLVISKPSPDSTTVDSATYNFGIRHVGLFKEKYLTNGDTGYVLQTETMIPILGTKPIEFGRAALEVCQEVPDETSINYSLRAWNGTSFTPWVPVIPINTESQVAATAVVDFSSPIEYSSEDFTTVYDSSLNAENLNLLKTNVSYRFQHINETVLNGYIDEGEDKITDLSLYRNIGYADGKYPLIDTDLTVRNISIGWGLDSDSQYFCSFRVDNPIGINIDFGSSQCFIDNNRGSGSFHISEGWHTFRTHRSNWIQLTASASLGITTPNSESELRRLDPLYPFNHKYLIEGYNYPSSFTGNKVYVGADEYAQHKGTREGTYSFFAAKQDLTIFALDENSAGKTICLLKYDTAYSDHVNERIRIYYSLRDVSYSGIQLKAVLKSDSNDKTPILSYYRIRVK